MLKTPIEDFESEKSEKSSKKGIQDDDEVVIDKIQKGKNPEKLCRICLGCDGEESDSNDDNPLFAPCVCSGTMKYVHLECMKEWVHNKRHSKECDKVKSYNWKFLECELCKHKIHEEFEYNQK